LVLELTSLKTAF